MSSWHSAAASRSALCLCGCRASSGRFCLRVLNAPRQDQHTVVTLASPNRRLERELAAEKRLRILAEQALEAELGVHCGPRRSPRRGSAPAPWRVRGGTTVQPLCLRRSQVTHDAHLKKYVADKTVNAATFYGQPQLQWRTSGGMPASRAVTTTVVLPQPG